MFLHLVVLAAGFSSRNPSSPLADDAGGGAEKLRVGMREEEDHLLSFKYDSGAAENTQISLLEDHAIPDGGYSWSGSTVPVDENFCRHLTDTTMVHVDTDLCDGVSASACNASYIFYPTQGDYSVCDGVSTGGCAPGTKHSCPWTFYMKDLEVDQNQTRYSCLSDLLEARRSLDGLLAAVNVSYAEMMVENAVIAAENETIRTLLDDQADAWKLYQEQQQECVVANHTSSTNLTNLFEELREMRALAAVSFRSNVRLDVDYNALEKGVADAERTRLAAGSGFVEQSLIQTSQAAAGTAAAAASSLIQTTASMTVDAQACKAFVVMVKRMADGHGMKYGPVTARDCDNQRSTLKNLFTNTFNLLATQYDEENQRLADEFSMCLSRATYNYKKTIEEDGGIDDQIRDAAEKIHVSQHTIALMEPHLHDLEHAVAKLRSFITDLSAQCEVDQDVHDRLENLATMILNMRECPGRNDFTLQIPHIDGWTDGITPTNPPTPMPTPYEWNGTLPQMDGFSNGEFAGAYWGSNGFTLDGDDIDGISDGNMLSTNTSATLIDGNHLMPHDHNGDRDGLALRNGSNGEQLNLDTWEGHKAMDWMKYNGGKADGHPDDSNLEGGGSLPVGGRPIKEYQYSVSRNSSCGSAVVCVTPESMLSMTVSATRDDVTACKIACGLRIDCDGFEFSVIDGQCHFRDCESPPDGPTAAPPDLPFDINLDCYEKGDISDI